MLQVGFGKVSPINTIWVGGLGGLNDQQIERHFGRYGRVTRVVVNRPKEQALVSFDSVESASIAQGEMKGRSMFGRRVRVSLASWKNFTFWEHFTNFDYLCQFLASTLYFFITVCTL